MEKRLKLGLVTLAVLTLLSCVGLLYWFAFAPVKSQGYHISQLTLHRESLYFGAGYCLYRLNVRDQNLDTIICTSNSTFHRPAVDGQRAYAQAVTNSLKASQFFAAIDLSTGAVAWQTARTQVNPHRLHWRKGRDYTFLIGGYVITTQGTEVCSYDAQTGHQMWCVASNHMDALVPFLIHSNSVWYAVCTGEGNFDDGSLDGALVAVDVDTGDVCEMVKSPPGVEFDRLLYVDEKLLLTIDINPKPSHILAIERDQIGKIAWRSEGASVSGADQAVLHGSLFIVDGYNGVYALNVETGEVAWTFDPDSVIVPNQDIEAIVLFSIEHRRSWTLYALDVASGAMIWEYHLKPPNTSSTHPIVNGDVVYITTRDSVDALDLSTGELLWQMDVDSRYEHYSDSARHTSD